MLKEAPPHPLRPGEFLQKRPSFFDDFHLTERGYSGLTVTKPAPNVLLWIDSLNLSSNAPSEHKDPAERLARLRLALIQALEQRPRQEYTRFLQILKDSTSVFSSPYLANLLDRSRPLTVFLPTDEGFQRTLANHPYAYRMEFLARSPPWSASAANVHTSLFKASWDEAGGGTDLLVHGVRGVFFHPEAGGGTDLLVHGVRGVFFHPEAGGGTDLLVHGVRGVFFHPASGFDPGYIPEEPLPPGVPPIPLQAGTMSMFEVVNMTGPGKLHVSTGVRARKGRVVSCCMEASCPKHCPIQIRPEKTALGSVCAPSFKCLIMLPCLSAVRAVVPAAKAFESLHRTVRRQRIFSSPFPREPVSMGLEQLRQGKVIPDVVDRFQDDTVLDLQVRYDGVEVANGAKLRVAQAQPKPHVEFRDPGFGDHLHTVLMVDPDAPSPQNPAFRHFLHWIVTNVPGSLPPKQQIWEQGHEVVPYMGPAPPEGQHRYVFLAYRQPQKLDVQPPQERKNFDVKAFTRQYNLSFPLAAVYFVSEHGQ